MTAFPERFAALERLLDYRRSSDGGWPQKLELANAPTTIVATAEVLEILRIRGLRYEDPTIQRGLRYLADQVKAQTTKAGRGEWHRFPAYALWGIMRYPAALHDPALSSGALFSAEWLIRHQLPGGGWSQGSQYDQIWLPATMVATTALDRLVGFTRGKVRSAAQAAAVRARSALRAFAIGRVKTQLAWPQWPGVEICPGATSLVVLTLAGGNADDRDAARAGMNWLAANPERWAQQVHFDEQIETRTWRILSFSLGVRALLHPCASRQITDPAIALAAEHFDALWNEAESGWADSVGRVASTSGSFGVVTAVHAMKRAWPFDPTDQLGLPSHPTRGGIDRRRRAHRVLIICEATREIRVDGPLGELLLLVRVEGSSQWELLSTLARRHYDATRAGASDQTDMTVSVHELAKLRQTQVATVLRTAARLNQALAREAAKGSQKSFVDLVEDHVPAGTDERRFALEEVEVRFIDEPSELRDTPESAV